MIPTYAQHIPRRGDKPAHWECTCDSPNQQRSCSGYEPPTSGDQTDYCRWSHDSEGRIVDWCKYPLTTTG